jgi:TetR/AcrR family transcriptional regulator, cholesterol catabolism regulator
LYQYVTDKDDLVKKTILLHLEMMDGVCTNVWTSEQNAIRQIFKIAEMMINMHKELNPALLFDLRKFHPESFQIFTQHRETQMQKQIIDNLKLGIEQNLYKEDMNIQLTAGFYMASIEHCLSSDMSLLNTVPFKEKYAYLVNYHLSAICTPEGIDYIKKNKTLDFQPNI